MRARAKRRWIWLGLACGLLGAGAQAAQQSIDLDKRYPSGSIKTAAVAERALSDAAAVQQSIDAQYKAESARCAHAFLANECQNTARRAHTSEQTQVHRVELEAHDLQRALAAKQRASERVEQQMQWKQQEAEQPEKEREAHKAAQQRADQAQMRGQDALRQQAQAPGNRARYDQRNAQHDQDEAKRASVQLRNVAENERRFQDKQAQAKAYAASRAREREENQKERERKRKAENGAETTDAPTPPAK